MNARFIRWLLLLCLLLVPVVSVQGEVLHGTVELHPYYMEGCDCGWDEAFDFSAQAIVPFASQFANLAYGEIAGGDGTQHWRALNANMFYYVTDAIESLLYVPASGGGVYSRIETAGTYVMHTDDSVWVKFTVRGGDTGTTIEYFVQTDGTRWFGTVATESTSWGRVKALYR